jgi:polyhydroxyalkanoate synthesis regulator phasin
MKVLVKYNNGQANIYAGNNLESIAELKAQGFAEEERVQDFQGNWITPEYYNSEEYQAQRALEEKLLAQTEIKSKIVELENRQARVIREMLLNDSENAKQRLADIEAQIEELRAEMLGIT